MVWQSLFMQMFSKECPLEGNSKVASLLAQSYCEFLVELASKGVYFCKLITMLLESEITFIDKISGKERPTTVIDAIITKV